MKKDLTETEYAVYGASAASETIHKMILGEIFVSVDFGGTKLALEIDKPHALKMIDVIKEFSSRGTDDIPFLVVEKIEGGFLSISFVDSEISRQWNREL